MLINFKNETLEILEKNGFNPSNVKFVYIPTFNGSGKEYFIPFEKFIEKCNFEYENGYGTEEINIGIMIVMENGTYFERGTYDGSEWWEYRKPIEFKGFSKSFNSNAIKNN